MISVDVYNPAMSESRRWFDIPLSHYAHGVPGFLPPGPFKMRVASTNAPVLCSLTRDLESTNRVFLDAVCSSLPPGRSRLVGPDSPDLVHPFQFGLSDWISDNIDEAMPEVSFGGFSIFSAGDLRDKLLAPGSAVYRLRKRVGSIVWHLTLTLRSLSDYVDWELYGVHSDPSNAEMEASITSLDIQSPFPVSLDQFHDRRSYGKPEWKNGKWRIALLRNIVLGDGQCTPVFRGAVLFYPGPGHLEEDSDRVLALFARASGRVQSGPMIYEEVSDVERVIALGPSPIGIPSSGTDARDRPQERAIAARTAMELETQSGPFWESWRFLSVGSNSPGTQADFGMMKGIEIFTFRRPEHLAPLLVQCETGFRPMHFREMDGSQVLKANHPDWFTYAQRTHYHPQQSPDRLGKPAWWPSFERNGWKNTDDQHLSFNLHASLAFCARSSFLLDMIESHKEAMRANIYLNPESGSGRGGVRAIGRRLSQAVYLALLGHPEDFQPFWEEVILTDLEQSYNAASGQRVTGPVRIQEPILDPRKLNGERPAWVVWEHGLLINGLASVLATRTKASRGNARDYARMLSKTVLEEGMRVEGGVLQFAQDVAYLDDGDRIDPARWDDSSWVWGVQDFHLGGWTDWIFSGIHWLHRHGYLEVLSSTVDDRLARMDDIVRSEWERAGRTTREWFVL